MAYQVSLENLVFKQILVPKIKNGPVPLWFSASSLSLSEGLYGLLQGRHTASLKFDAALPPLSDSWKLLQISRRETRNLRNVLQRTRAFAHKPTSLERILPCHHGTAVAPRWTSRSKFQRSFPRGRGGGGGVELCKLISSSTTQHSCAGRTVAR